MFAYDNASRLSTAGDGTNTATYAYLANSPLVEHLTFTRNGTTNMVTSKQFDYINRLTGIQSVPSASSVVSSSYGYNSANQRTALTNAAGEFWNFGYDSLGQVTSGRRKWSDGTHVAGQQFEYAFDDIGNRTYAAAGGDTSGANLRTNNYSANLLNQYTNRDFAGYVDVQGSAATNATVTVNNQSTERKGPFYRKELQFTNTSTAVNAGITNVAVISGGGPMGEDIVTTQTGTKFLPQTPESFTFDSDGNLTSDARWTNLWNGENRLVQMDSMASAVSVGAANLKLNFDYDSQGRRIRKQVAHWTGSEWQNTNDLRFVYDGWNLVAELEGTNIVRSYTWGTDLSGSMQGAGGVGGLLAMRVHSGANAGEYVFAYDGNGNVIALVNTATGVEAARYEYSPFGQLLQATGPLALENKFRFSTKYCDDETGYYYYGFRFYNPDSGRWLNRDPIKEWGGLNIYRFVGNNGVNRFDILGLVDYTIQGVPAGLFSWIADFDYRTLPHGPFAEAYEELRGIPPPRDFNSRLNTALRELAKSSNPDPGMSWPGDIKETRGWVRFIPEITCECWAWNRRRIKSHRVASLDHNYGYTPTGVVLPGVGEVYDRGHGVGPFRSVSVGTSCVTYSIRHKSRVGAHGQLISGALLGVGVPWVWRTIEYKFCCDGTYDIKFSASDFPSQRAYVDDRAVKTSVQSNLAKFMFAGDAVDGPGGHKHTETGTIYE